MAVDFFGTEILEGDIVAYTVIGYRTLARGKVMKVCAKMIFIGEQCADGSYDTEEWRWRKQFHSQVVCEKSITK